MFLCHNQSTIQLNQPTYQPINEPTNQLTPPNPKIGELRGAGLPGGGGHEVARRARLAHDGRRLRCVACVRAFWVLPKACGSTGSTSMPPSTRPNGLPRQAPSACSFTPAPKPTIRTRTTPSLTIYNKTGGCTVTLVQKSAVGVLERTIKSAYRSVRHFY